MRNSSLFNQTEAETSMPLAEQQEPAVCCDTKVKKKCKNCGKCSKRVT